MIEKQYRRHDFDVYYMKTHTSTKYTFDTIYRQINMSRIVVYFEAIRCTRQHYLLPLSYVPVATTYQKQLNTCQVFNWSLVFPLLSLVADYNVLYLLLEYVLVPICGYTAVFGVLRVNAASIRRFYAVSTAHTASWHSFAVFRPSVPALNTSRTHRTTYLFR